MARRIAVHARGPGPARRVRGSGPHRSDRDAAGGRGESAADERGQAGRVAASDVDHHRTAEHSIGRGGRIRRSRSPRGPALVIPRSGLSRARRCGRGGPVRRHLRHRGDGDDRRWTERVPLRREDGRTAACTGSPDLTGPRDGGDARRPRVRVRRLRFRPSVRARLQLWNERREVDRALADARGSRGGRRRRARRPRVSRRWRRRDRRLAPRHLGLRGHRAVVDPRSAPDAARSSGRRCVPRQHLRGRRQRRPAGLRVLPPGPR